jgi:hypothetical protein
MGVSAREQLQASESIALSEEALSFLEAIDRGETDGISCWRSPDVERRYGSSIDGQGVFATDKIAANTLIGIKQGRVVDSQTVKENAEVINGSHQQIDRNHFLAGLTPEDVDKNLLGYNHSCDPNSHIVLVEGLALSFLVSNRPIDGDKSEEITVDYSLTQASDTALVSICRCGSDKCRGFVAPLWDWESSTFQQEHAGELAWYIEDMIEERRQADPEVLRAHSEYAPLKMAAFIRISDDEINGLQQKKEELFSDAVSGLRQEAQAIFPPFSLVPLGVMLRSKFEKGYSKSEAYKDLQRLEEVRLGLATYFCTLSLPDGLYDKREFGLEIDESTLFRAVVTGEDRDVRREVQKHLPQIVALARRLDYEYNA